MIIQAFGDVGFVREAKCLFFLARAENIATAVLKHIAVFNFASQFPFREIRPDTENISWRYQRVSGLVPVSCVHGDNHMCAA